MTGWNRLCYTKV